MVSEKKDAGRAPRQYEVRYFARKHHITAVKARGILAKAGRDRDKANELAHDNWPRLPF